MSGPPDQRSKMSGNREVLDTLEAMLRSSDARVKISAALALLFIHRLEAEGLYCFIRRLAEEGDAVQRRGANRAIEAFDLGKGASLKKALGEFGEDSIFYLLSGYGLDHFD